jgi:hypothetical protein
LVGVWHGCVCVWLVVSPGAAEGAVVVWGVDCVTPPMVEPESGAVVVTGAAVVAGAVVVVGAVCVVVTGAVVVVAAVVVAGSVVVAAVLVAPSVVVSGTVVAAADVDVAATGSVVVTGSGEPMTASSVWSVRFMPLLRLVTRAGRGEKVGRLTVRPEPAQYVVPMGTGAS